jgi:3D (Asp-Asp-Asp) domain-containing protein
MGADVYQGASFGVLFVHEGYARSVQTDAVTVQAQEDEMGMQLHPFDRVSPPLYTEIHRGLVLEVERAFPVYVRLDAECDDTSSLIPFYARPGAALVTIVADFSRDFDDNVSFLFDSTLARHRPAPAEIIDLQTVTWATHKIDTAIPYERIYTDTFFLPVGESEIYQYGVPGLLRTTYHAEYISNLQNHKDFVSNDIIYDPVTEIMLIGIPLPANTAISGCGEIFSYNRMVLMESTAYTLSFQCTGRHPDHPLFGVTASGMMAGVGIVAVDTSVIPFHTRMYIEGYGFAVAGDRGGAIRGYMVDVFF